MRTIEILSHNENLEQSPSYCVMAQEGKYVQLPEAETIRAYVTREYLFGTHVPSEYKQNRRERVLHGYNKYGINYLYSHPIVACAVPEGESIRIAILDGHTRIRYLGIFEHADSIKIPTYIISVRLGASLQNLPSTEPARKIFNGLINDTLLSFDRKMSRHNDLHRLFRPSLPIFYYNAPFIWDKLYPEVAKQH